MLSIGAMSGGQQHYYLDLAREDYYLNGGEPPGRWVGGGAAALGLTGTVAGEALTRLFSGLHPHEDRSLIQQQKCQDRDHRPGWDLTFSAPKSVSVLWSQADHATRHAVQDAQQAAVQAALSYLEEEVAVTRSGAGGRTKEAARLVMATFEHHTSRAQDPQLHTHALVLNACLDERGKSGALESRPLYRAKMAAGAIYRAELAVQLENRLGLACERRGNLFEIAGVAQGVIDFFSKRRAEVEQALSQSGHTSAAAAALATLGTRQTKTLIPQEDLTADWRKQGEARGWGREQADRLLEKSLARGRDRSQGRDQNRDAEREQKQEREEALRQATRRATEGQSYFNQRDFTRYLAEECQGRGVGAAELRAARDSFLSQSEEIVPLGRQGRELIYTTREMMEEERKLLAAVDQSLEKSQAGVSPAGINRVIAARPILGEEQVEALRHITQDGGSIRVVSGMAGTGKTTLLEAARTAWEAEGFEVYGAALSGKAAEGVREGAGIASETLHRLLWDIRGGECVLHPQAVVVVDEAGMVGTRLMREVIEATQNAGSRLVLVGDAGQLQSIEAGGPLPEIERRVGSATLTDIKRQRDDWAREAVKDFAAGEAQQGLRAYAERGLLTVAPDRHGAMEALIEVWKEQGVRAPQEQLILAGTRQEAAALNRMAQDERRRAGELGTRALDLPNSHETLSDGDRILFTKKSRLHGVENGSLGNVLCAGDDGVLTVRLDNGHRVEFDLANYAHVRPGYAMTTHKGQGATTERAYILAGGAMQDREISYVQMSRSRGETRIFTDVFEAGESLSQLAQQMSHSRQKELAHAAQARSSQAPPSPVSTESRRKSPSRGIGF